MAAYALALWVGWVITATQRLREESLVVQMVEELPYQSVFLNLTHRMQWLHFYGVAGGVAAVYALTRKKTGTIETWLLYGLVFAGFAVLISLYNMYSVVERWKPIVEIVDPNAPELPSHQKSNVVLEGLGAMALVLVLLCVASLMRQRKAVWKTLETVALVLVFVITLAFSSVSQMIQGSTHLKKVGLQPADVSKLRAVVQDLGTKMGVPAAGQTQQAPAGEGAAAR